MLQRYNFFRRKQKKTGEKIVYSDIMLIFAAKYITMTRTTHTTLLTIMVGLGLFMLSACSSDDNQNADSEATKVLSPLNTAADKLNQDMAGLDFKELDPLMETITLGTRAEDDATPSDVDIKLTALISLLQEDEGKGITYGRRFSYQAFNTALELAYDLSVVLKSNGESSSSWFGLKTKGKGEVTYTARNGQPYRVSAEMEKDFSISHWNFDIESASQLYIYKGDELLLRIISNSERNRPVWLPLLIRGNSFTGELLYRDYLVTLAYNREHTHERSVVLTYGKTAVETPLLVMNTTLTDDADILRLIKHDVTVEADFTVTAMNDLFVFKGHSNNVNYLVVNGIKIAKYMQEGTTDEEECQRLVADFNDNLQLSLNLSVNPVGDLFMGIVHDPANGRSYPTVMMHASIFGEEDIPLTTMLKKFGIDIPDILQTVAQFDN